ncbi:MAG: hypothetical protein DI535_19765 [Citrobacter freundii]|nr:MAG: hypothetical protein DI535_19765 [Citrobacter freundii]
MKKLFILVAVASLGFVACNNESANTEAKTDSLVDKVDSSANATTDSIKAASDSLVKKVDSTATAVKDSLKK